MKKLVFLLLIVLSYNAFAQNELVEFDEIVINHVLSLWTVDGNSFESKISKGGNLELTQFNEFLKELAKKENYIADYQFVRKPSDNTLVAYYLHTKLKWNIFNPMVGLKKLKNKKVVELAVKNLPQRYELLAFYYKAIFVDLLNKQDSMKLGERSIDLDSLNLFNETEQSIVFLCAMLHLGGQITSYCSGPNFPKNCFRGEKFVSNMPKFNGGWFYEYELPEFEDFLIEVDKRYPKVSFKERFIPEFENAKTSYRNCQNQEN